MARFMMTYRGAATDMSEMTEEQGKAVMDSWMAWMGRVGDALVDVGAPFGASAAVVDDGSAGTAAQLNGYSIVEADDLDAAAALADGHPFLSEGKGNFAVDVYELTPVPFEA